MKPTIRPVFSGHDTFQCRHLWLKKGYDYIKAGKSFGAENALGLAITNLGALEKGLI